jgi:single-stranded-DNA-specific exonuclease
MIIKERELIGKILDESNQYPLFLKRILAGRGVDSANEISGTLKELLPVSKLKNITQAAQLITSHIEQQNNLLIVGDFDADGATSTALLIRALHLFGHTKVEYLVPNRFEYGYGLSPELVIEAEKSQPNLLITVDNGISSHKGVEIAKAKGWDVLITDHHLPAETLPEANVIVNPNLNDDEFPSKSLAGVGVVFYIVLAVKKSLQEAEWFSQQNIPPPNLVQLLDLVALGTIADVVPLDRNNRILVEQGLQLIRQGKCTPGIQALFQVAGKSLYRAISTDLGFVCGPRLNAAGRLDDMSVGIECLLTNDPSTAMDYAQLLDDYNRERREIEAEMKQEAMRILDDLQVDNDNNDSLPTVICLFNPMWHQGVVGILAARIKERFNRPVIVFALASDAEDETEIKGSARSIEGLHIRDLLADVDVQHPDLIKKFGGHAMAAGLSLKKTDFETFQQAIINIADKNCNKSIFTEQVFSDGELPTNEMTLETAEALRYLAPWGQHFPEPLFHGDFIIKQKQILKEKHLRLNLYQHSQPDQLLSAIAFNTDVENWPNQNETVQLLYQFDVNEFRGVKSPQLIIRKRIT